MTKTNKGFTLIELLVVIAIIGILSSVVLASLNTARNKGADSAIKSQLAAIRPQAEIIYDSLSSYGVGFSATGGTTEACPTAAANNLFATTSVLSQIAGAASSAGGAANVSCVTDTDNTTVATKYAIAARLKSDNTQAWCVDSSGASKQETWTAVDADAIASKCP